MASLLYRPDMDDVRQRLTAWWQGGDLGRPALQIVVPRAEPFEIVPALPEPPGWTCGYSTRNFEYRVNLALRACVNHHYLGEAVPSVAPDLAPNCLALFLGCKGVEGQETVWCEPFLSDPDKAVFAFDEQNFYWQFTTRLAREQLRLGAGKFLTSFPDFIEGLDTLAAMRGTQDLLVDLIERPGWVHDCLQKITDLYFRYYDPYYTLLKDETGGSTFWIWAPGRVAKLQCDFSAMISPTMFGAFMVPVLKTMCAKFDHSLYHWDGPGAIPHLDHLLSLADLDVIQWTPGDGHEPDFDRRWWPLFHRIVDGGKKVFIGLYKAGQGDDLVRCIHTLKREFGPKFKSFIINVYASDLKTAERIIQTATE